ncbi:MAG TPA: ATP-binding protein, partial [Planctomycetota bacterium]|nr:ATP-binding protein [Planctomycetota bacterium]
MKLTVKVVGIMGLAVVVSAVFLYLNLRQFDSLYHDRGRQMTELSGQIVLARTLQVSFKKQVQEWKDILLRGRNPADLEKYRGQFEAQESDVARRVQELLSQVRDSETRKNIEDFSTAHRSLGEAYRSSLAAYLDTFDLFASDRMVRGLDRRPTDLLDDVVSTLEKSLVTAREAHTRLWNTQWQWASLTSALFFFLFLAIMGLLSASFARPIVSLARIMRRDEKEPSLPTTLASDRRDEIGELFAAFNQMQRTAREHDQALLEERNALADREARLRSFTQSVSDGIVSTDASGIVLTWNEAATEMLGYSQQEIVGKPLLMLIPAHDQRRMSETMNQLLGPGEDGDRARRAKLEVDGLSKEGTPIRLDVSLASWKNGPSTYLGAILRDVTEQRKVEHLKDEFVSTVNHELRTPLTAIRGSLGLLAGGVFPDLPAKAKSMIELAHKNCERLARLVNDILDIDKLESGKVSWVAKPNDAGALVRQSLELNRAFSDHMGVSVTLEECAEAANILVDPDRFNQVMTNLLSNAIKFSPRGQSVRVSVSKKDGRVRVEIRDSGPGIPDEFRKRIFQKFAQAETSDARVRQGQGTGLGLAISKAIVERMKGTIGFDTQMGAGTVFFFTLPL